MDFRALVKKLIELETKKTLMESGKEDQLRGKEKAPKAGKANPHSKHPFVGRLVGETEEIDEDLVSELTNEFIDFLSTKDDAKPLKDDELLPHDRVNPKGRNVATRVGNVSPENPNMDGPYEFQSGATLFYDRTEGQYFDRKTGSYVSDEDMQWHIGLKNKPTSQPADGLDPEKEVINTDLGEEGFQSSDPINALKFIKLYIETYKDQVKYDSDAVEVMLEAFTVRINGVLDTL